MAYSVNNIVPLNMLLTPAGIGSANFTTCFFFSPIGDMELGAGLSADDVVDYFELSEVEEDWGTDSPAYLAATRWFSQIPRPRNFTVWVWDDVADDALTVSNRAAASKDFRFFYFYPKAVTDDNAAVTSLANFAGANSVYLAFVRSDADLKDGNATDTIADQLLSAGHRFVSMGYREQETIDNDPTQAYAYAQQAAAFQRFNPDGERTAITGEYQVLPGVVGESLSGGEYQALKDRNVTFWTQVELKGQTDASRAINTKSFSAFGEFLDDVYNLEVLKNRAQVAVYNYITQRKRALDEKGFGGNIAALEQVLKQFFNNGVLGAIEYTDPRDGETKLAEFGYVIFSDPSDVQGRTLSQRASREYPPLQGRVFLARAGHVAEINLEVE